MRSAEETDTQGSIEGLSRVPGTQGLSAWWLLPWEALKGPETQPRVFLQVDAFLTDLLWVGAWSWVISQWPFNLWEGWGQGRGSRPARGWRAGRQGACQCETSQEDRWGGLRGWQSGGETLPCNPPSSLGQQMRAEGQTGGWSCPSSCSSFYQLSSGF